METVSITTRVEVNIYEVKDKYGNELSFEADTDSDGDIIVTVDSELDSVERVRDYIADNSLFGTLAEECCESRSSTMVGAFLNYNPSNAVDAISHNTQDFLDALFETNNQAIKDLIIDIVREAKQDD